MRGRSKNRLRFLGGVPERASTTDVENIPHRHARIRSGDDEFGRELFYSAIAPQTPRITFFHGTLSSYPRLRIKNSDLSRKINIFPRIRGFSHRAVNNEHQRSRHGNQRSLARNQRIVDARTSPKSRLSPLFRTSATLTKKGAKVNPPRPFIIRRKTVRTSRPAPPEPRCRRLQNRERAHTPDPADC